MSSSVTVLMPVYNAERYLNEAIDSILSQSFDDFEFLIIDDGSTDNSATIIQDYRDPRIRFVRNEVNMGISKTLNLGISLAQNELIARMDADDVSHPQRLKKQHQYMVNNRSCAMLSSWANVMSEEGRFIRMERFPSDFHAYNLTFECWIYHPTVMYRKSAVIAVGGYSMPYSEDYDLFWKLSIRYPIATLMEPLLDYRLSATSLNAVTRKTEYDRANEQNVLRNIRFYMGNNYTIPSHSLACLRHDFDPIVRLGSLYEIVCTLDRLEDITKHFQDHHESRISKEKVRQAFKRKRTFIAWQIALRLPALQASRLLAMINGWNIFFIGLKQSARWRLQRYIARVKNLLHGQLAKRKNTAVST